MGTEQEICDNQKFSEKPVCKFLDGNHHFIIPSYQRGYRWDSKQVKDMLEDLCQFANDGNDKNNKYFLQPIVVKNTADGWEVLDGQQRLTTMRLILQVFLNDGYMTVAETSVFLPSLYKIDYKSRPELNFDNPIPSDNIDSYYLANAKSEIESWMKDKLLKKKTKTIGAIKDCLFTEDNVKKAYFIWYPVPETSDDESSIKVFNRLNKGKISLTGSELIKALFIMDCNRKITDDPESEKEANQHEEQLSMEWAEMEQKFQDDNFWYFLSNKEEQTRIDLLFDFVTGKKKDDDSDYSYRMFQNLYDYNLNQNSTELNTVWVEKRDLAKKSTYTMDDAWKAVKETFNRVLSWYESNLYYHYIGFLITRDKLPLEIYNQLEEEKKNAHKEWTDDDTQHSLRYLIRNEFKINGKLLEESNIDGIEYESELARRLLLLFNIETCIKTENQRFDFAKFKKESWDVEHIDSQNDATLQDFNERITWMENVEKCLKIEIQANIPEVEAAKILEEECATLISRFKERNQVEQNSYSEFYKKINAHFGSGDSSDANKDNISNLTLLNSSTNREYKDAPFMYKRQVIIQKDKDGKCFLPICTRNCFLKYYTDSENDISQLDAMRWNKTDKSNYLSALHTVLNPIFATKPREEEND